MKYCTECGSEYENDVAVCADDGNRELVPAAVMKARGIPTEEERDTRRFVRAGTAEDPLSSERYTRVLTDAQIPVFARPRRAGTVDGITSGSVSPWYELLVPEEHLARATQVLTEARRELDADADENARAAEQEAMGTAPADKI